MFRLPEGAKCLSCGYDLRGLPRSVCPECGNAFDPANPLTYWHPDLGTRRRVRALRKHLMPPLFDCAAVVMAALFGIYATSSRDVTELRGFVPLWLLAMGCAACYAAGRRAAAATAFTSADLPVPTAGRRRAQVLLWSGIVLVAVLIYPWHTVVRFYLSFYAFHSIVQSDEFRNDPSWVGLFRVGKVRRYPNGTVFFATGGTRTWYGGETGIVYAPQSGKRSGKPYRLCRPLAPNWWTASFR